MAAAAAGPMTAEQQAIIALQNQVAQIGANHEALRAAHDALNLAAQNALAEKDAKINSMEVNLKNSIFRQQFDLLDAKELKPDVFKGRATESFKPWQRKMKAFCNSKRTGFRQAPRMGRKTGI